MRKRKSFFWQMVGGAILLVALAIFWPIKSDNTFNRLDISDKQLVANGKKIYVAHCASCHGAKLEGQANWKERGADGLYHAPVANLIGRLQSLDDNQDFVMVIGHNPAVSDFLNMVMNSVQKQAGLPQVLPTSGIAVFEGNFNKWRDAVPALFTLQSLLRPGR